MTYYVDIDGTLTTKQRRYWWRQPNGIREDVVAKVRALIADGHEVILWSGGTGYAKRAAREMGIDGVTCIGKPNVLVDNERRRWGNRLKNRMITPEDFVGGDNG